MKYVILVCASFLAGGAFAKTADGDDPAKALPLVCKATPRELNGSVVPERCWDGRHTRYLMPGYGVVSMEGGFYLVGWAK
jgi:hypothetical protein